MFSLRAISKFGITTAGLMMMIGLLAGCSGPGAGENGGLPDRPAAGAQPTETTLGGSSNRAAGSPASSDVITSGGKVITAPSTEPSTPFYSPGTAGTASFGDSTGRRQQPKATEAISGWLGHNDETYGFFIKYPNTYVILPEPSALPVTTPQIVYRVRFQDKQKASGQFADREPAQFSIHVFELDEPVELLDWLKTQGLLPTQQTPAEGRSAGAEPVQLAGAGEGWRVLLPRMLAPREFYYFASEKNVYRLTPLGLHSQDMLASFQLSPG